MEGVKRWKTGYKHFCLLAHVIWEMGDSFRVSVYLSVHVLENYE